MDTHLWSTKGRRLIPYSTRSSGGCPGCMTPKRWRQSHARFVCLFWTDLFSFWVVAHILPNLLIEYRFNRFQDDIECLQRRPQTVPRRKWKGGNKQGGSCYCGILLHGHLNSCGSTTAIIMTTYKWPERHYKSKTVMNLVAHQNGQCDVSSTAGMFQPEEYLQDQALPFWLRWHTKSICKLTRDKHNSMQESTVSQDYTIKAIP